MYENEEDRSSALAVVEDESSSVSEADRKRNDVSLGIVGSVTDLTAEGLDCSNASTSEDGVATETFEYDSRRRVHAVHTLRYKKYVPCMYRVPDGEIGEFT